MSRNDEGQSQEDGGYQAVPVPYQVPSSDKADLIDKIKPERVVELMRHRLLGEVEENNVWVKKEAFKELSLSELGAWQLSNLLLGVASQNTSLSKLKDEEIKARVYSICETAQDMCHAHWLAYNIQSSAQLCFIHELIFTGALVVLKQADGASIQELLKGTVQESRIMQSEQPRQSKLRRMIGL